MQNLPGNVDSYLARHSIKGYDIEWKSKKGINNVIAVPAIAEYNNLKILLNSLSKNDPTFFSSTLVLFVINNSQASESKIKDDNLKSLIMLRSIIRLKSGDEFADQITRSGLQIGIIDAASYGKELSANQSGVGLARKIGMDLALTVFDYTQNTKKLILCLDADCKVSSHYLTNVVNEFNSNDISAAIVNFEHKIQEADETCAAIICYEIFLRYYVAGLKFARSDYAFHTIGSTMVCNHNAYIKIGGMNKREAAEDFYFLEKMAKNFKISKISSSTVYPSNRCSWRVPFGTGQRVTRFMQKTHDEHLLFNPEVFEILKSWLNLYNSGRPIAPEQTLNLSKEIHIELYNFLCKQNFEEQWEKILNNTKSDKQFKLQKKIWFDGFKTLKLIHHLRDSSFPLKNMFEALDEFFIKLNIDNSIERNKEMIPGLEIQKEYLSLLRKIDNNTE
jgi:hypothetical protein